MDMHVIILKYLGDSERERARREFQERADELAVDVNFLDELFTAGASDDGMTEVFLVNILHAVHTIHVIQTHQMLRVSRGQLIHTNILVFMKFITE